ncbi:hypothetical protein DY023_06600 [Microbacterium bovistercoris]|uniref:Uncharacterized protein n=2 Tax=Microbacterium bovistercoris TaxID=2293570 RepID=A0A371NV11_9MICO|nr:hypothetical protein DY023_06600 [Microbacterium bovistercoris]
MSEDARSQLACRVFSDLLDIRDGDALGDVVTMRLRHLHSDDAVFVASYVLAWQTLLITEVRMRSKSAANTIAEVREGLMADLVAERLKGESYGDRG